MDFDREIDRTQSYSSKWLKYQGRDVLPLWVADMDFRSPQPVIDALHRRVEHGVFGYTKAPGELADVIVARMAEIYSWSIKPEDITFLPGVVSALNLVCGAYCSAAQSALTALPIYPPFQSAPVNAGVGLSTCEAELRDGRWSYPLERMAQLFVSENIGVFELCSPYNPLGRAFAADELTAIADLCCDHDVIICSDEIHCDLLFDGRRHVPTASLSERIAQNCVTLMAPSKTFNIAGLGGAFTIIQNPALRRRFRRQMKGVVPDVNLLGYEAMLAAYRDGEEWYQSLIAYLQANRDFLYREINALPGISMNQVEATFLAWLDVRSLELEDPMTYFEEAGLGFSDGRDFGAPGYMRMNFGCPRSVLERALERLDKAVRDR